MFFYLLFSDIGANYIFTLITIFLMKIAHGKTSLMAMEKGNQECVRVMRKDGEIRQHMSNLH